MLNILQTREIHTLVPLKVGVLETGEARQKRKHRDGAHRLGFWMLWFRPQTQLTRKQWRSQDVVLTLWNNGGEEVASAPKNPASSTKSLVATETSLCLPTIAQGATGHREPGNSTAGV